jgi:ubiquitin-protein ligase
MSDLKNSSSLFTFKCEGELPTKYQVELMCGGLCRVESEVFKIGNHKFDIILEEKFPFGPPLIIWKTPIFHPNFKFPFVCMGDHWYPGWNLAEMCVTICEMVQYKSFNIYDPLNVEAVEWVKKELIENPATFPVDDRPVRDLDFSIVHKSSPKEKKDAG